MRAIIKKAKKYMQNRRYNKISSPESYAIGSAQWLQAVEKKFGGYVEGVRRHKVSKRDPRSVEQLSVGGMIGGDRMFHHNYASEYSRALSPLLKDRSANLTIVEIGILQGTGLALWKELFPNADVLGLDIDTSHYNNNLPRLLENGAFIAGQPELHLFDQFVDGEERVREILNGRKPSIVIDDGFHSLETIENSAMAFKGYLSNSFVYFSEDNKDAHIPLRKVFPNKCITSENSLCVVEDFHEA